MMRAVIDDIVSTFSSRIDSHKSSWPRMQRCMMQDVADMDGGGEIGIAFNDGRMVLEAQTWAVSHAMEFNGEVYNLFGGWNADLIARLVRVNEFDGSFISLERPFPDVRKILQPREDKSDLKMPVQVWEKLDRLHRDTPMVMHERLVDPHGTVVFGDSHSVAHYKRGRLVLRHDGLTLNRLLETSLLEWVRLNRYCAHLILCAGNIDVRHHLCRRGDPVVSTLELLSRLDALRNQLLRQRYADRISIVGLLPVEHEGRKIPKSGGWYKNSPFFGSQEERAALVRLFNTKAAEMYADDFVPWPSRWYEIPPEEFAAAYMEKPQSMHLSPRFHHWDYEGNRLNPVLLEEYNRAS